MIYTIIQALLLWVALIIACFTDIKSLKIPNRLTFPFICLAVIFNYISSRETLLSNFIAAVVILFIGMIGGVGAGDTKLLIGCAFLTGWAVTTVGVYLALFLFVVSKIIKEPKQFIASIKKLIQSKTARYNGAEEKKAFAPYITIGIIPVYFISIICEVI